MAQRKREYSTLLEGMNQRGESTRDRQKEGGRKRRRGATNRLAGFNRGSSSRETD
ncbi:hypothetical protein ALC60_12983 [Trachymyrmex zeteki]|uniref:Uncharacterized protein n=1 Tax=Mycetomoellerius zeteki TaxID=64791 RepID=A0A151WJH1_9HYME|nr:hypothetical protein ALC60_12983 [Trachymyrmex zeteki]